MALSDLLCVLIEVEFLYIFQHYSIAPDKDWRQLGIYPPLFDLIGYLKFKIGYLKFLYWISIRKQISNETGPCFS